MKISKKRSEPVKETQMVSLADIAFLIIFFFMLSSQFMKDRTTINLPRIPKTAETHSQNTVSMDAKNNIRLNGEAVTRATLEAELRKTLEGRPPAECEVRFRCDQLVMYEDYTPVIEAISNAGGTVMILQDVK